jgi:hypothetical protein
MSSRDRLPRMGNVGRYEEERESLWMDPKECSQPQQQAERLREEGVESNRRADTRTDARQIHPRQHYQIRQGPIAARTGPPGLPFQRGR